MTEKFLSQDYLVDKCFNLALKVSFSCPCVMGLLSRKDLTKDHLKYSYAYDISFYSTEICAKRWTVGVRVWLKRNLAHSIFNLTTRSLSVGAWASWMSTTDVCPTTSFTASATVKSESKRKLASRGNYLLTYFPYSPFQGWRPPT